MRISYQFLNCGHPLHSYMGGLFQTYVSMYIQLFEQVRFASITRKSVGVQNASNIAYLCKIHSSSQLCSVLVFQHDSTKYWRSLCRGPI